jgi:two-component system NtrC family sensor kinase
VRLQESEEQLIQAEKLSSLGQMAASIAHEINNPLAGVLVYTQLIAKKLAQGTLSKEVALDYLAKMAREVDRSSRIIRNLLDFARPSELSLGDVEINGVIEDALALVGHRATLGRIEVVRDLGPDLPKGYADYDQFRQVLVNLMLNAIQATPAGGRMTLRTRTGPDGSLTLTVADTGCGISEANRKKLFTPFFTTKEKGEGVGLGLAVAKGIIEKHAGSIEVESVEGEGTTFIVTLPAQAQTSALATAHVVSDAATSGGVEGDALA